MTTGQLFQLRSAKLNGAEIVAISEVLKAYLRGRRRQPLAALQRELQVPAWRWRIFVAVGRWSKKARKLVAANGDIFRLASLERLAMKAWDDARSLCAALARRAQHLRAWKRISPRERFDRIRAALLRRKAEAAAKVERFRVLARSPSGAVTSVISENPRATGESLINCGYTIVGVEVVS